MVKVSSSFPLLTVDDELMGGVRGVGGVGGVGSERRGIAANG